jgi:hypothetical protein
MRIDRTSVSGCRGMTHYLPGSGICSPCSSILQMLRMRCFRRIMQSMPGKLTVRIMTGYIDVVFSSHQLFSINVNKKVFCFLTCFLGGIAFDHLPLGGLFAFIPVFSLSFFNVPETVSVLYAAAYLFSPFFISERRVSEAFMSSTDVWFTLIMPL